MKFKAALFISVFFLATQAIFSQDFEVAPIRLQYSANPGESITKTIAVRNHSNKKTTITLRHRDYLIYRDGKMEVLPAESTKNTIARWITINPSYVSLEPNEEMLVQVTMQTPQDDYTSKWGIISLESAAEQTAFSADKSVKAGIAVLGRIDVYLSYNPLGVTDKVGINNIQEITTSDDKERIFQVNLENTGDKITNCKVYLIASNLATGEETRFPTTELSAYPQSSRTIQLNLPNELKPGQYSLAAILDHTGSSTLKGTQMLIVVEK